jgi:uncharacterized protein
MSDCPVPAAALTSHIAILGKTGSGKTSTGKAIVEHLVAQGARVCIIDPIKSDWWGLISSADGREPGLPFCILGGPHGHVPLHPSAGKQIAEVVAGGSLGLSIIDMSEFPPGGMAKFFIEFAPTLLRRNSAPLHLVIEEAHELAPKERSGIGDENMLVHHVKRLATAGRSKGIRLMVLTQRTQALHNAVLGSCETMIAHRLTAPADQKPVVEWLKANLSKDKAAEISGSLASIKTGSAWLCSGEAGIFEQVTFPRIKTFDNSATPVGAGNSRQVNAAKVDIDRLRGLIGEPAEPDAGDVKALRDQVAALKQKLAERGAPDAGETEQARDDGYVHGLRNGYAQGLTETLDMLQLVITKAIEDVRGKNMADSSHIVAGTITMEQAARMVKSQMGGSPIGDSEKATAARVPSTAAGNLNSAARKMLLVVDTNPPVRRTWTQIATLAGLKARGGHFNEGKKHLLDRKIVAEEGGLVSIVTPSKGASKPAVDPAALVETWASNLSGAAPKILRHLFKVRHATKDGIAKALDMQPRGGHWNAGWKELRDNDIVEFSGDVVRLTSLFRTGG